MSETTPMLAGLLDEEFELPFEPGTPPDEIISAVGDDLTHVRAMLVRLKQLEREHAQVQRVRAAVLDSYDHKLKGLADQAEELKAALAGLLERGPHGSKLTFPDVARINLTTKGGNLRLANQEEAVSTYGFRFERVVCDVAAMNQWARDHFRETGEIPTGYEVQPKYKALVVAKP